MKKTFTIQVSIDVEAEDKAKAYLQVYEALNAIPDFGWESGDIITETDTGEESSTQQAFDDSVGRD